MSNEIFSRGLLTDALLDYLESETSNGLLVGDGMAPLDGGWTGGEPGKGDFVPYVVLSTGPAQKQSRDPLGGMENSSWLATYTTKHVGALRQQTDWAADQVRKAMVKFRPAHIDLDGDWAIVQTTYPQLGAISRNDAVDPPYWELVDNLSVWLEVHLS